MTKKANLAAALSKAGGSTRRKPEPEQQTEPTERQPYNQPSREGTAPIMAHYPRSVRDQLKILAVEEHTTIQDLLAEAINDLFAKYGKPEIAPRKKINEQAQA